MLKFTAQFIKVCGENLEKCDFQTEEELSSKLKEPKKAAKKSTFIQMEEPLPSVIDVL